MWSSSRRVLQELVTHPSLVKKSFSITACRNTVIVERWWQVPLAKEGSPATSRLYPRRHRIYKLVEDTTHTPKEKMELILTQTVPKLGGRGDTVFVKKSVGRNKLLPHGLAVYPSPENKEIFAEEMRILREGKLEERRQTRTGQMTVEFLKCSSLKINSIPPMADFELTKEIVCRQFLRKLGVVVPPHALRLPDEPIKELGDHWCEVTVNGIDTVRVPMSLMPYEDRSVKNQQEMQPEVVSTAEADISEAEEVVVIDGAAEAVKAVETPLAEVSVMAEPEASAAPPAEALEDVAASLEAPLAEASVTSEAAAAPPAEAVEETTASLETPSVEASDASAALSAPPEVSVTAETANDKPVPPTETPKKN